MKSLRSFLISPQQEAREASAFRASAFTARWRFQPGDRFRLERLIRYAAPPPCRSNAWKSCPMGGFVIGSNFAH